jgi:hypothetical protein
LKDEIEKKIKKKRKKNNSSQLGFTCQNCNPGHMTNITPQKAIKTNYETKSLINQILKDVEKNIN